MGLYTGFGDWGETALSDGTRVSKDNPRVSAFGAVDELNAFLGWCRVVATGSIADRLLVIQHDLFDMGAYLAVPPDSPQAGSAPPIADERCRRLEAWIEEASAAAGPIANFILPGGCELAARLHVARTCCRRTERGVVSLHRQAPLAQAVIVYLNRLGDLLFAWSRQANQEANCPDVPWKPGDLGTA